jgi:hypothetical protein
MGQSEYNGVSTGSGLADMGSTETTQYGTVDLIIKL